MKKKILTLKNLGPLQELPLALGPSNWAFRINKRKEKKTQLKIYNCSTQGDPPFVFMEGPGISLVGPGHSQSESVTLK